MTNGLLRVWRENCAECAQETADRHRRETGHPVEVAITNDTPNMWELREMTRRARMVLINQNRGW